MIIYFGLFFIMLISSFRLFFLINLLVKVEFCEKKKEKRKCVNLCISRKIFKVDLILLYL